MSKFFRLMALCVTALCCQCSYAQHRVLSIEDLFVLADERSSSVRVSRSGAEAADEAVGAARAARLPDVNVSVSASYLGDGTLWDRDFRGVTGISMPHFGNNFALEAEQVVYAGGAINGGIELARLGKVAADLGVERSRQDVRFLLVGYYLNLYKLNNQIIVLHKNLELTDQVIANMMVRREQGTALKNDITRYELQKENLKLQLAQLEDERKIMNHQLVTTLHLPVGTVVVPDSALLEREVMTLAEDDWQRLAAENSLDIREAEVNVKMNEQKVKVERSELLPHVAIVAADHLDGPITIEVPVLDNNFNYWYVGVGVKYSLSSLFKNNRKVRQAKVNVRQAQEECLLAQEHVENAVQSGYVNFLTAFTDLRTQEKSVELADENYAVTSNRYRNELALLTDMLDASNMKLSADLGLVNARINVIYNFYKMKYVSHTL